MPLLCRYYAVIMPLLCRYYAVIMPLNQASQSQPSCKTRSGRPRRRHCLSHPSVLGSRGNRIHFGEKLKQLPIWSRWTTQGCSSDIFGSRASRSARAGNRKYVFAHGKRSHCKSGSEISGANMSAFSCTLTGSCGSVFSH